MSRTTHHELSPSKFPAWRACPAFDSTLEEREDATRGTRQHEALASALAGDPARLRALDPDGAEAVAWAVSIVKGLAAGDPIQSEVRVAYKVPDSFAQGGMAEVFFGTADVLVFHGTGAESTLLDYKSGADDFDHYAQLAGYALAVFSMRPRVKLVRAHVAYGRIQKVVSYSFTKEDAGAVVMPILEARQSADRKPHPCVYCSLCRHAATCPALVAGAVAVAGDPPEWRDCLPAMMDPAGITDTTLMSKAMNLAKMVSTWSDAIRARATELAKGGATIPGWRIQERRGSRDMPDIAVTIERAGLTPGQVLSACKLSIPKLTDVVATARSIPKKQAAQVIDTELADLIREGSPTFSLVQDKVG